MTIKTTNQLAIGDLGWFHSPVSRLDPNPAAIAGPARKITDIRAAGVGGRYPMTIAVRLGQDPGWTVLSCDAAWQVV